MAYQRLLSVGFLLFILVAGSVSAQISTDTGRLKERKEAVREKREMFRQKLKEIRDKRKQAVVERIDTKMTKVNERRTSRWVEVLNKLSSIMERLQKKTDDAKTQGKDTKAAEDAIFKANDAIATAQSTVSSQAGREYVIELGEESAVRGAVGAVVNQLQQDLRATHKAVVDAKQAVMNVSGEVAKLK
ncbi:hypothetical protein HYT33_03750 [Candidatus Roizmanbacteria bacterium]|nr:hypothetical protein [Candidatus Roizmanbacteria bacterium]